jgi:hypothetical protein
MSCLRLGSLFGIFGITKFRICSSRNSIGSEISNHVAGMNRNAESLRRLGDLHEAWVFRCPKGRTPPGCTTPRQWGRTPPDAARHSAPEGRAGCQLEDPRAAGDSELHFIQVSSCSATVCHGGPGCSAHPVRRNAMTHFNTSLAQPAKKMLASQPTSESS